MTGRLAVAACVVMVLWGVLGAASSMAQAPGFRAERAGADRWMAAEAQRMALASLAGGDRPSPAQLTLAKAWLGQARALDPTWAEPYRLSVELARREEDPQAVIDALSALLKVDRGNETAQLALIEARVALLQTVDERLSQLERVLDLGERSGLSEAVRSRLASSAAELALEQGDQTRYGRWLKEAIRLDAANPAAAELAYRLAVDRDASPIELGTSAVLRVRGRPTDADARMALGSILMSEAAYAQAAEQFGAAGQVGSIELTQPYVEVAVFALGAANRTEAANGLINRYLGLLQSRLKPGESIEPTPALAVLQVVLLATSELDVYAEAERRVFDVVKQQWLERAAAGDNDAVLELAWLSGLTGLDLDEAEAALAEADLASPLARRAAGWVAMASGQTDRARDLLAPLADRDAWARLGMLLMLSEANGERAGRLTQFVQAYAAQTAALYAVRVLTEMGEDVPPTPTGEALLRLMDRFPERLWNPEPRYEPWTLLKLTPSALSYSFGEPIELTAELQNRSRLAVAIGPGGALPTTALLSLTAAPPGRPLATVPPVAIDLARELRLEAGASAEVTVRLEATGLGDLIRRSPWTPWGVRIGGLLNPVAGPAGRLVEGKLGARADAGPIQVDGAGIDGPMIESEIDGLGQTSGARRMLALARLASLGRWVEADQAAAQAVDDAVVIKAGDALALAWHGLDDAERAMTLRLMGASVAGDRYYGRVLDLARRDEAALVQMVMLWEFADGPNDGLVSGVMRTSGGAVRDYATALVEAWGSGVLAPGGDVPPAGSSEAAVGGDG
ncbi:MAG: hypothetical protein AAGI54_10005 [Planctomycetota bacterium]